MSRSRTLVLVIVAVTLVGLPLLTGCGATPTPTAVPPTAVPTKAATAVPPTQPPATKAPTSAPTAVPPTATAIPPTPTKGPAVGGKLVWALLADPDTLDAGNSHGGGGAVQVITMLGATLVANGPAGNSVPYLAESWKVSSDGLTWEFKLRKGVKFHDGAPLTAADFAWTLARDKDPVRASGRAGARLSRVDEAVAIDDYTLQLKLSAPFFPLLYNVADCYLQPLEKAAVEKSGTDYGRNPVGVGPYKFKEWILGTKVVLERNPDYTWAPAYAHQGPAYIQTIEVLTIPEESTQLAGLEAGEVDLLGWTVAPKDLPRFQDPQRFQIKSFIYFGIGPHVAFNVSKPPFDDIRVRQAFNMAFDKEAMVKVLTLGTGVVQYGPLSPATIGYWPGVEKIGYRFDLAKAKDLMTQAGYVPGADGMFTKDGQPFKVTLKSWPVAGYDRIAAVVQEMLEAFGVDVEIKLQEFGLEIEDVFAGNYEMALWAWDEPEADMLYTMYHSRQIGATNTARIADPELDKILDQTRNEIDPDKRQAAVDAAQQYIVEKAVNAPLYSERMSYVLNASPTSAVKG